MSLHKLTAGDGYTYLTRQVAALDATERGYGSLGEYYSARGESPGIWMGAGVSQLPHFLGGPVTEAQMIALFGEGRHPDAERIEQDLRAAGHGVREILAATRLGSPYRLYDGVNELRQRVAQQVAAYNLHRDQPATAAVPAGVRAKIRSEVGREMFTAEYGRAPADVREFSGFLAKASRRNTTTAVAGYDLTFSPVKSVSALWAIAPREVAQVIEAAHTEAVADVLGWLERSATFTRMGRNGVRQVEVCGLLAAAFTHRDSRAGDPDLHTHLAISNKVQTLQGRWLALDGRPIHKLTVAASERYDTRLEALLTERLGVRFGPRADRPAIREILGVEQALTTRWSSRRADIVARKAELTAAFAAAHGRAHTPAEGIALARQATLQTRAAKHEPRSLGEQRAVWRSEAIETLGGPDQLHGMLRDVLHPKPVRVAQLSPGWVAAAAVEVIRTVQSARASWQECHVRAEAERAVRTQGLASHRVDDIVEQVVRTALSPAHSVRLGAREAVEEPVELRRSDGTSVYTVAGSELYTSPAVLAAEQALLTAAGRSDGRVAAAANVEVALLEALANGTELNPGQAQLVRELAGSGRRVQLALAPAGTGKTTAMRVLTRAWMADGGDVLGLAPSAAAAAVLREEIGVPTDTIAKLQHDLTAQIPPEWVARVGAATLVIIDEAAMAGTTQLADVAEFVIARGGSVRLVGDDQQLSAIGAGGVLRDIRDTTGALSLSHVVRFTDPAEAAAGLALRDGDTAGIGFYLDHSRVHVGDESTMVAAAYAAWKADLDAGRDAILLAPTRELVTALNERARTDRLAGASAPTGQQVRLGDGSACSAGDPVISRRNERRIPITSRDWVTNGDRWAVRGVRPDGGLEVTHRRTGRHLTLPASYVAEHVALGYACTVHAAQGITAESCHSIATGAETRQSLYVALTRGRTSNHVYLAIAPNGDPHSAITRDALLPPSAGEVLARILHRDGCPTSATTTGKQLTDPATALHTAADRYHDAVLTVAELHLGEQAMTAIDTTAEAALPGLTGQPAYPTLRCHLALLKLHGHDPATLLAAAISTRELGDALDPAAVLDWRLNPPTTNAAVTGPLPWLPVIPPALAEVEHWARYLTRRDTQVRELATQVTARARSWTPATTPAWAGALIHGDTTLLAEVAVWRAANGVPDTEPALTGAPRALSAEARYQEGLNERISARLANPASIAARWRVLAERIDAHLLSDLYWPTVAGRLDAAQRAGVDITRLTLEVAAERTLPDEHPAAALWWRLSRRLSPATLTGQPGTELRPAWTDNLTEVLGQQVAQRVREDAAWPALVAAVSDATGTGWKAEQILGAAHDLLAGAQPADEPLRPGEIATALLWRVRLLTKHSATAAEDEHLDHDLSRVTAHCGEDHPKPEPVARVGGLTSTAIDRDLDEDDTVVPRDRLAELNAQAMAYYAEQLAGSWAASYLHERLGDLANDHRFTFGYAPPGPGTLSEHLSLLAATDEELLTAGLVIRTRSGALIDAFRDRLILPIWDHQPGAEAERIAGFLARGNPTRKDAGPKYLNTPDTDLFHKGRVLFGLNEGAHDLAGGATPVLVEGAFDAIAVTLAGGGQYIGIASLGTAFTDTQAELLRRHLTADPTQLIIATDTDPAGDRAAEQAFWKLTARGAADPRRLAITGAKDPAELLQTSGPAALHAALTNSRSLAGKLITDRIAQHTGRLDTVEGTLAAARATAAIIGALHPTRWAAHIEHVDTQLDLTPGALAHEVARAGTAWTEHGLIPPPPPTPPPPKRPPPLPPTARWHDLADRIDPAITNSVDWPHLAQALDRAAAAGYNVKSWLPELARRERLAHSGHTPASALHARLVHDIPAAGTTDDRAWRPSRRPDIGRHHTITRDRTR